MRQSKAEIYLHLVWATAGRERFLTPEIERCVHRCIQEEAQGLGAMVLAIGGMPDHVHLAVKIPTRLSAAVLAKQIKGISSLFVHKHLPGHERFRWQEGVGVFSFSRSQKERVVAYVKNQKQHHAEGSVHPAWEETEEEYTPSDAD